jgi:hypothetical protein
MKGQQVTPDSDSKASVSRLKPCPVPLKAVIDFVNQVPGEVALVDLGKQLPDFDSEFLRFLKATSGIDEGFSALPSGPRKDGIERLLELHRLVRWALAVLPEQTRVRLWQEAFMPQRMFGRNYGPKGKLSRRDVEKQTRLACDLGPRFANEPLEQSLSFLSKFARSSQKNARLYFWAIYGLAKRYCRLHEYRTNLDNIMKIAELNPSDRLTFSEVLYDIVISQRYSVNDRGRFIQISNPFTDALEEEEVDVTRIRSCETCKIIFWAGRIDQMCCTPVCNHARHSRRTREKYRQGYYQGSQVNRTQREIGNELNEIMKGRT